jgi:hypothetical protein
MYWKEKKRKKRDQLINQNIAHFGRKYNTFFFFFFDEDCFCQVSAKNIDY